MRKKHMNNIRNFISSFFEKGVAFFISLWYNIMRLRVSLRSRRFHTEVYRSGHNGLDSKSSGE